MFNLQKTAKDKKRDFKGENSFKMKMIPGADIRGSAQHGTIHRYHKYVGKMLVCRRMEETMFQIGEYVVHGNDGICEVKDITQLELPGGRF